MRVNYAIVFVSNMARSVVFYRDVVGLPLKFESPEWTEFATGGATLALHIGEPPEPGVSEPGHVRAGRCNPGFAVDNIDDFHKRMIGNNVACIRQPENLHGIRLAEYADPDGLPISVSQERVG